MGLLEFFTGDQPPLIKDSIEDVCVMLNTGRDMFAAASAVLLDNEILTVDLEVTDEEINRREQATRHAVLEHLNVDPKRELVLSLKLITVVQEAERIGDLALMLGHAAKLAQRPRMASDAGDLRSLRSRTVAMFDRTRDCFVAGDPELARELRREGAGIKADVARCLGDLAARGDLTANEAVVYTLAAYAIRRVSSHLANIASAVTAPFHKIRGTAA